MPNLSEPKPSESFGPNTDPEKAPSGDYFEYEIKFIDEAISLIGSLEKYATPTRRVFEFEFLGQESGIYAYPEALKDRLMTRNLQTVSLTITQEDDEPSTTTIELRDEDGVIHISRDSVLSDGSFDTVIDNRGQAKTITKIPNYEINSFLLSLTGNYHEAEYSTLLQNAQDMVVGENIFAALESNAVQKKSYFEYKLDDDRSVYFTKVSSADRDKLTSFRIIYKDNNLDKKSAEMNLDKGLAIIFKSFDNLTTNDIFPDEDEYIELIQLMTEETDLILSNLEKPDMPIGYVTDDLSANPADPNHTEI